MKSLLAITAVLLISAACESTPDQHCAIIHKPKDGCPKGYIQESYQRFTEKDGSKEFACVSDDKAKEGCTDVLKAGESEELRMLIAPQQEDSPAPSQDQDKL